MGISEQMDEEIGKETYMKEASSRDFSMDLARVTKEIKQCNEEFKWLAAVFTSPALEAATPDVTKLITEEMERLINNRSALNEEKQKLIAKKQLISETMPRISMKDLDPVIEALGKILLDSAATRDEKNLAIEALMQVSKEAEFRNKAGIPPKRKTERTARACGYVPTGKTEKTC